MKKNNKGFTLAELLIVVAIIAVLVAIAIPIFTAQLEKAKEATDIANVRAAYAEVVTQYLDDAKSHTATVTAKQASGSWKTSPKPVLNTRLDGKESAKSIPSGHTATSNPTYTISIDKDGKVSIS